MSSGLTADDAYRDVTFAVRAGEVVGLAGNAGSGKVEVAETNRRPPGQSDAGRVEVDGVTPRPGSVPAALAAGIGLVPRDRHHEGFVPLLSIAENATMTISDRLVTKHGLIDRKRARRGRAPDDRPALDQDAGPELASRIALGREPAEGRHGACARERPEGARPDHADRRRSTSAARKPCSRPSARPRERGTGVLIVSDDLDELRPCDRVLVMFRGRIVRSIDRAGKTVTS